MENESTGQIKTEVSNDTEVKIKYEEPREELGQVTRLMDIVGGIRTVDTVPTHTPSDIIDQVLNYKSGSTERLYIYDIKNGEWNYYTQEAIVAQYQTTLTEDNNTGSTSTNYTQTISGLSFAPHTVIFNGTHDMQTQLYIIDGIATKNGNVTTGNCRSMKLTSGVSVFLSTSKLGATSANDYFTVSSWNSDGVVISKTLFGSYGSGNDKFSGILTLIG
jgi:hypothetical protein